MKKMLVIGAGALLFIVVNVGLSVAANKFFAAPVTAIGPAGEAPAAAVPEEIFYHNIQPEFVVNLPGATRARFLMIEMAVAASDEAVSAVLDDHDPELRNALLSLFSEQDSEALKTSAGKDALRLAALEVVDGIVTHYMKPQLVKEIFITRLVIQ